LTTEHWRLFVVEGTEIVGIAGNIAVEWILEGIFLTDVNLFGGRSTCLFSSIVSISPWQLLKIIGLIKFSKEVCRFIEIGSFNLFLQLNLLLFLKIRVIKIIFHFFVPLVFILENILRRLLWLAVFRTNFEWTKCFFFIVLFTYLILCRCNLLGWWDLFICLGLFLFEDFNLRLNSLLGRSLGLWLFGKARPLFLFTGLVSGFFSNPSNAKGPELLVYLVFIPMTVTIILRPFFDDPVIAWSWTWIVLVLGANSGDIKFFIT